LSKNVYAQRSEVLPETSTEAEWEYAAAADVGQESIIFTRGRRNMVEWLYMFWKRQSREIN
jgi:formylglycine-generating enzyme required for sulfatase activity